MKLTAINADFVLEMRDGRAVATIGGRDYFATDRIPEAYHKIIGKFAGSRGWSLCDFDYPMSAAKDGDMPWSRLLDDARRTEDDAYRAEAEQIIAAWDNDRSVLLESGEKLF